MRQNARHGILDSMVQQRSLASEWIWRVADVLGMTSRLERRDRRRLKANFEAVLSGPMGLVQVRGLDASRRGIGVLSPEALEIGALVFVRLKDLGLSGFARVRRCEAHADAGFVAGLEFRDELARERAEFGNWQLKHITHGACGAWDTADA